MSSSAATLNATPQPRPEGLEGVVAASTALSHVFGEEGRLVYRGYDIHELAGKASFEEVAFLLWNGHLPTREELASLHQRLGANRWLSEPVITTLKTLPADTAPMRMRSPLASSASPPPAAASGNALRIDGEPDVPDWRPSPIQGSESMPLLISAAGGCMFTTSADPG